MTARLWRADLSSTLSCLRLLPDRLHQGLLLAGQARPKPPSSHWLGLASSARTHSIGRRAAQAFLVLFCMTREGALGKGV